MGVMCSLLSTINMPNDSPPSLLILENVLKIAPFWTYSEKKLFFNVA